MHFALYWTVWIALTLFVLAQHGQGRNSAGSLAGWVGWANALGLILCAIHILLAMSSVHAWRHETAAEATALQTEAVYGLRWGGGLYVNYFFVLIWAFDAWLSGARRPQLLDAPVVRWSIRTFYAIVIVNAAVVFARGSMRVIGVTLVAALLLAWRPTPVRRSL